MMLCRLQTLTPAFPGGAASRRSRSRAIAGSLRKLMRTRGLERVQVGIDERRRPWRRCTRWRAVRRSRFAYPGGVVQSPALLARTAARRRCARA